MLMTTTTAISSSLHLCHFHRLPKSLALARQSSWIVPMEPLEVPFPRSHRQAHFRSLCLRASRGTGHRVPPRLPRLSAEVPPFVTFRRWSLSWWNWMDCPSMARDSSSPTKSLSMNEWALSTELFLSLSGGRFQASWPGLIHRFQ